MHRCETRKVKLGNILLGGQDKVLIQTMCNIKTSRYNEVIAQILDLEKRGVDYVRLAIMDQEDAVAIGKIKAATHIPLVADIHFDYQLALLAIENGIDKIRINPGNIGSKENIQKIVTACKEKKIPIRIGVNSGSLDSQFATAGGKIRAEALVKSAKKHIQILEDLDFHDIVISLKGSDVLETIAAYRLAAKLFPYPLHLGITEAGTKDIGVIRSVAGLAPLILEGIGDTIRISLTDEPKEEVKVCKRLLHDLGLYPNYPTLIACPTCGRTKVRVQEVAKVIEEALDLISTPITIAVMGCVVNGPGEARCADIGIAGGKDEWILFKKGEIIKKVTEKEALEEILKEIGA